MLSGLDESTSFYTVISLITSITSITDILLEVCQLIKENRNAEIQNFYYNNDNLFSISNCRTWDFLIIGLINGSDAVLEDPGLDGEPVIQIEEVTVDGYAYMDNDIYLWGTQISNSFGLYLSKPMNLLMKLIIILMGLG